MYAFAESDAERDAGRDEALAGSRLEEDNLAAPLHTVIQ